MALDLKKALRKEVVNNNGGGNFIKVTTMRDFPVVAVQVVRFGTGVGYDKVTPQDTIIGHTVALDSKNKVVFSEANGIWSFNKSQDKKNGGYKESNAFRGFPKDDLPYVRVFKINKRKPDWSDVEMNMYDDIEDLTDKQVAALEEALDALAASSTESTNNGWGNTSTHTERPY